MLISKKVILKPLLESSDGVHLSIYLVNRGDLLDLKSQLKDAIDQADHWLDPVMCIEERGKFLEPLQSLLLDARVLKKMKKNIGLFRNKHSFRLLNVPVDVEQTCQVATSFHIKPLLRWLQTDQDFLLLGLERDLMHLYQGSQESFKLICSIKQVDGLMWISDLISQLTRGSKAKLFLAGEKSLVDDVKQKISYKNLVKTPVTNNFGRQNVGEVCHAVRRILKDDSKRLLEKALLEFRFAEENNRTSKNIFQISKAIARKKVRKLIITDEIRIYGKIDKISGGVSIHPFDLDHEDDDLLDDLAQMVLSQGGEVVVAKRHEIPKGRPILAILSGGDDELEKFEELQSHEILQERFG